MSVRSEKTAREVESLLKQHGLHIDGGELRDLLQTELEDKGGGDLWPRDPSAKSAEDTMTSAAPVSNAAPTFDPKARWFPNEYREWVLIAPCKRFEGEGGMGTYEIHLTPRPSYCDRGDWLIHVDGTNDLDWADGFPRYFFGTLEEAKAQMETWLKRRGGYIKATT